MPAILLRRFFLGLFALVLSLASARADLVWTQESGWKVQGGILSGLSKQEGENALRLMNRARRAEENSSYRTAVRAYERVGKKYPNSIYASEAYYRAAMIRFRQQRWQKSFDHFQAVISRYPNSSRFDEIIGHEYEIATRLLNGARGRILWVLPGFTNREKGMEHAEVVAFNAPYSEYSPVALMAVARQHERSGDPEMAIDALDRMINGYPRHVLAPSAYLRIGELYASLVQGPYYDQGATREAITYFEDFMILFPNDDKVGRAETNLIEIKKQFALSKMKIGDFYFKKRQNFKGARVFYNEAITAFPESTVAEEARQKLEQVTVAEAKAEEKAKAEAAKNKGKKRKRFLLF